MNMEGDHLKTNHWIRRDGAHGTVLNIKVPDTHDWDTSWGSSVSNVKFENGSAKTIVIGHDKMGNVIAMDALTGKEIWWTTLGKQINIDSLPLALRERNDLVKRNL